MICGALQTLNEEAMEDVLQSEPASHTGEASLCSIRECGSAAGLAPAPAPPLPDRGEGGATRRDHVLLDVADDVYG